MVRSLRAGLDQYQDPNVQRQIEQIMAQKVPNNPVKGVQYIFDRYLAGELRRKDRKQRTAASGALTTGSENQTKIIDAIKAQKAVEARPAMGKVSNQELYEMDAAPGGVNANRELYEQDGGWSNFEDAAPAMAAREASPEIKAQMARIDPNSGALYGRSQALAELLRTNPDNPYAQGALLDNAGQLSNRNANLQLQQMNNQNKLATIANNRAFSKLTLAEKREYTEGREALKAANASAIELAKYDRTKLESRNLLKFEDRLKTKQELRKNYAEAVRDHIKSYQDVGASGNMIPPFPSFEQWSNPRSTGQPATGQPATGQPATGQPVVRKSLAELKADQAGQIETQKKAAALKSKNIEKMPSRLLSIQSKINKLPMLKKNIEIAKKLASSDYTSGLAGQIFAPFGNTEQYKLNSVSKQIEATVGIKELLEVKKQGGTFGALSEKELGLLVNAVGSLDTITDPTIYNATLDNIMNLYEKGISQDKTAFKKMYPKEVAPWDKKMTPMQKKISEMTEAQKIDRIIELEKKSRGGF